MKKCCEEMMDDFCKQMMKSMQKSMRREMKKMMSEMASGKKEKECCGSQKGKIKAIPGKKQKAAA